MSYTDLKYGFLKLSDIEDMKSRLGLCVECTKNTGSLLENPELWDCKAETISGTNGYATMKGKLVCHGYESIIQKYWSLIKKK